MTNYEWIKTLTKEEMQALICKDFLNNCEYCDAYFRKKCHYEDNVVLKWLGAEHKQK